MWKVITAAALISVGTVSMTPADAKVCRNSHGRRFHCHNVLAPRVNLKAKHPVKVVRCRGHVGKFNKC
jgi:hypothetical protein